MPSPILCDACRKLVRVQDLASIDPFSVFNLPVRYGLPRAELEKAYLGVSKSLHPDYFRDQPEEQAAARRLSALANDSYSVLKDSLKRAQLLVRLWAGDEAASDKGVAPGFLEEQLALREKAEAVKEDDVAREALRRITLDRLMAAEKEIADRMAAADAGTDREVILRQVRQRLNELNYHRKLLRRLEKDEAES
jgi:Fe-S protein assembly co-chaperone HscB